MATTPARGGRWPLFLSEFVGTALLVLVGLSIVVFMFGAGTPMAALLPDEAARRGLTGFLFGATGAAIALSPVGKVSGAHVNPVVTLTFWVFRRLDLRTASGYVAAQVLGACTGSLPLLAWGEMGESVAFGATLPGEGWSMADVVYGEVATTFAMLALLTLFLAFRESRRFTPALFPPLYAVMVALEAPISGTSTNPARSLGPALVSGQWNGWWAYWVGPFLGMALAVVACSWLVRRIHVAKLYHFDHDPRGLLRREPRRGLAAG